MLSAFGMCGIYAHFVGKDHPHKWHTLFRLCFVIVFGVINHWFLVPHFYIKRRYAFFFSIVLLCLVSLLVLPDIILKAPEFESPDFVKPNFEPPKFKEGHPPPYLQTLLVELAHMYLLFFITTFTSIAMRTRQYMQRVEEQQATEAIPNNEYEKEETIKVKPTEIALTVTVNYSLVRIEYSIKSMDNYLLFHLHDKKPILVRMTLKEASEKLPKDAFLRVHKSYIVAVAAIESIRNKTILIAKQEIPIGRTYEERISTILQK